MQSSQTVGGCDGGVGKGVSSSCLGGWEWKEVQVVAQVLGQMTVFLSDGLLFSPACLRWDVC